MSERRKRASANWRRLSKDFIAKVVDRVGEEEALEKQTLNLTEWLENVRNEVRMQADVHVDKDEIFFKEDALRVSLLLPRVGQ